MTVMVVMMMSGSPHLIHDSVGLFNVIIGFLKAGVHGTVMVAGILHHGWMARKKAEHALHSPCTKFGSDRQSRTLISYVGLSAAVRGRSPILHQGLVAGICRNGSRSAFDMEKPSGMIA